jgi:hypothetical protein
MKHKVSRAFIKNIRGKFLRLKQRNDGKFCFDKFDGFGYFLGKLDAEQQQTF